MINVNIFELMTCYLTSGNFYDAIKTLEDRYHENDFKIVFVFATLFYVLQNKNDVKKVLNSKCVAGYQNHNFDVASGHMLNINALPAFIEGRVNPLWQGIHTGILNSVGNAKTISQLVAKHFPTFLEKTTFDLDVAFQNFMERFWCEFMFGDKVDAKKFSQTRAKLLDALHYTYYDSKLRNIPFVGSQAGKLYAYLKQNDFKQIDKELEDYLASAEDCLFSRLRNYLINDPRFPRDKINTALLDNAFVLILALDFIQNAMYEALAEVVRSGLKTIEQRKAVYPQGLHEAFLFPFRTRVLQEKIALDKETIPEGSTVYINLLKSGLYHSAGPRTCAGVGVTQWIREAIWEQLKNVELQWVKTSYPADREKLSHSKDVPISPQRYTVNWHYSRDYLQKILPHYEFKGVKEFFDVLKIHEKPFLSHYVVMSFVDSIKKLNLDPKTLCIAAPEMRGVPVAAMVADALQIPLVIIRKPGKIPGEVIAKKYVNAYADDTLEMSASADVKNKNVILIDDGIASGGTTITCCDLIKQLGGKVSTIMAMINHTYKEKVPELKNYKVETLFDFASVSPKTASIPTADIIKANSLFKPLATVMDHKPEIKPVYKIAI